MSSYKKKIYLYNIDIIYFIAPVSFRFQRSYVIVIITYYYNYRDRANESCNRQGPKMRLCTYIPAHSVSWDTKSFFTCVSLYALWCDTRE